jgi:Uma2 family endonuclease
MATQLRKTDAGRRPYRLTADQLERMIEAGIIPEGNDLELMGGILYKMVKKEPHNFTVRQVAEALRRMLPDNFRVREEKSLRQGKRSLPEPDVVVVAGRSGDYRPQPPSVSEVPLIVEVCHHTQQADYRDKYRRYTATRVAVYWIVDLHHRRVEVFVDPVRVGDTASYSGRQSFAEGRSVPVVLGQKIGDIAVVNLMPPVSSS